VQRSVTERRRESNPIGVELLPADDVAEWATKVKHGMRMSPKAARTSLCL
jgi:hypothetical protein